jgi:LysM repeat protein
MNYQIRSGDTLTSIAARYGTSVSALARDNGINNPNRIFAGQTLRVPGHSTVDSFEPAQRPAATGPRGDVNGSTELAEAARRTALNMGGYRSGGECARGVNRSILNAFGIRTYGHGNQVDNNLPRSHFREVNLSLEEALRTPGLVLTWETTPTRLGRIYGHTAITSGNGRSSYSDFVESNTLASSRGRTGLRVFAPING